MRRTAAIVLALAAALIATAPAQAAPRLAKVGDFDAPVHIASPPNDPRLFVVEQDGRVKVISGGTTKTFLDVSAITAVGGSERGLLSIAFPPDYATLGPASTSTSRRGSPAGQIQVREYRRSARTPTPPIPRAADRVLRRPPRRANHNGGQLQFGPDGRLWIGDRRRRRVQRPRRQRPEPGVAAREAPAHRPRRAAPSRRSSPSACATRGASPSTAHTGDLVIGDVGQGAREELDFAPAPDWRRPAASNYGWPCFEGTTAQHGSRAILGARTPPAT